MNSSLTPPPTHSGSDTHTLSLFNVNGALLNSLQPYSPSLFHAGRSKALSCTAFHPHQMMLAAAGVGHGYVNIYTCVGEKELERRK